MERSRLARLTRLQVNQTVIDVPWLRYLAVQDNVALDYMQSWLANIDWAAEADPKSHLRTTVCLPCC